MTNGRSLLFGRRRLSLWAAGLCLAVASCILAPEEAAVQRASRELNCPENDIVAIERDDISASVYDIGACGQRARYDCFYAAESARHVRTQCVREPDPPRWDPDPTTIAKPPAPSGVGHASTTHGPPVVRVCGMTDQDDCLDKDQGIWRRRPAAPAQHSPNTYVQ